MVKRKTIVISIVLCIITMLVVLFTDDMLMLLLLKTDVPKMSRTEITDYLYRNEEIFENTSKIMLDNPSIIEISRQSSYLNVRDDWFFYNISNGLCVLSKKKLGDNILQQIENSNIHLIIKKHGFEKVVNDNNGIYFIESSNLSYSNGIFYAPTKEKPKEYVIETDKIDEYWYYLKSG